MNRNTFEERGETPDGIAVKIVQNIYGNWYGYAGGKKVEWFMGASPDADARDWFAKVRTGDLLLKRRHETTADFKERLRLLMPRREKSAVVRSPEDRGYHPPPKLATEHVRAGEQLGERYGVKTTKINENVTAFVYRDGEVRAIVDRGENPFVVIDSEKKPMPLRAARALGHFLVNNAREQH